LKSDKQQANTAAVHFRILEVDPFYPGAGYAVAVGL